MTGERGDRERQGRPARAANGNQDGRRGRGQATRTTGEGRPSERVCGGEMRARCRGESSYVHVRKTKALRAPRSDGCELLDQTAAWRPAQVWAGAPVPSSGHT